MVRGIYLKIFCLFRAMHIQDGTCLHECRIVCIWRSNHMSKRSAKHGFANGVLNSYDFLMNQNSLRREYLISGLINLISGRIL